jgi:hypothetical protein
LANLDQDLPNYAQHAVPIHSLPQEWLWCETWCSDDSKEKVCYIYYKIQMKKTIITIFQLRLVTVDSIPTCNGWIFIFYDIIFTYHYILGENNRFVQQSIE